MAQEKLGNGAWLLFGFNCICYTRILRREETYSETHFKRPLVLPYGEDSGSPSRKGVVGIPRHIWGHKLVDEA